MIRSTVIASKGKVRIGLKTEFTEKKANTATQNKNSTQTRICFFI